MATSLRCAAAASSAQALRKVLGYGGGMGARAVANANVCSTLGAVTGTKLQVRSCWRSSGHDVGRKAFTVTASAVEAASVEMELDAEQAQLLQRRKDILEAEERASGFVISEVETTGHQDWHGAKVVGVRQVAAGVCCVTLETEVSRELVSLESAYTKPGHVAQIRLNGKELKAVPSSSPHSAKINVSVLYKLRGDIPAGTTKLPAFSLSVKAPLEIHVEESTNPELYSVREGQELEVGPFIQWAGLDLRPILTLARFPTIVFFVRGQGAAVARAVVEAKDADNGSISLSFRHDVRLFYSASTPSQLAYQDKFVDWESRNVKVRTTVDDASGAEWQGNVGSLRSLWDDDDLEYDPNTTGAIVCVEEDIRQEVMDLLEEAGIPKEQIVSWEN